METFIIKHQAKPVKFTGTLLADESTETDSSMRWLELELYKIEQGQHSGQYVIHRVGQSVVYHRPKTCGYGTATGWENVPMDAEPCPTCKPSSPVARGSELKEYEVWLESPRHRVIVCPAPRDVEKALLMRRKDGSTFLSTPATNLIAKACANDPGLDAYFNEAEEL